MIARRVRRVPPSFVAAIAGGAGAATSLPERLSDADSAPSGAAGRGRLLRGENITNLTSNELWFQVIPDLVARTKPGNVYLGV